MRFPIFSAHSDPAVDLPLCRKSRSYVEDLLRRGQARQLHPDLKQGVQVIAHNGHRPLALSELVSVLSDWKMVRISHLPDQECLMITTRQLDT